MHSNLWSQVESLTQGVGQVSEVGDGAVFESSHFDDNNVQSISHKCIVSRYNKKTDKNEKQDEYCAVGHFDPVEGNVTFYEGVLDKQ